MYSPIMAKCDDCGTESDQNDLYDSPWKDNKIRCESCFLISQGYDPQMVNDWASRLADFARQYLAEMAHHNAAKQAVRGVSEGAQ